MASIEAILAITAGLVGILTLFVLFSTGSIIAVLALWLVVALIILVLWYYGFISFDELSSDLTPKPEAKAAPTPAPVSTTASGPKVGSEVFHIDDSQFTYADAPAVCAAYGAELATLEQIIDAYNHGAEWCGYGWSSGGFALYPTQKATWEALQAEPDTVKRTACGRPGVNGGYFDPNTKFGVNCFGFKPSGKAELPLPPPGTDPTAFKKAVAKFRAMIASFNLTPYSRNEWSGYDSTVAGKTAKYGTQFSEGANSLMGGSGKENFEQGDQSVAEAPATSAAYSAAPYGLKGDPGATGPAGPAGPIGPPGTPGLAGTIGGVGATGAQGIQGIKGDTGSKGDKGDRGLQGVPGTAGSAIGVVGQKGDKGDKGLKGDKGDQGVQGIAGIAGKDGAQGLTGRQGESGIQGGKMQLGSWTIDGVQNNGNDVTFNKGGRNGFILRDNAGFSELWMNSGGSWSMLGKPAPPVTGLSTLTATSTGEEKMNAFIKDFPGSEWIKTGAEPSCKTDSECSTKYCHHFITKWGDVGRCSVRESDRTAYRFM